MLQLHTVKLTLLLRGRWCDARFEGAGKGTGQHPPHPHVTTAMQIAVFSTKPYDRGYFATYGTDGHFDFTFFEAQLS